jgi:hypothetical protein
MNTAKPDGKVSVFLQAGLGNQFFQIYAAMAYAIENKKKLVIPELKWDAHNRPPYWDSVFKRLRDSVDPALKPGSMPRLMEEGFHYAPLPFKQDPVILFGYFQSYKYFDKHAEAIHKKLNIRMEQEMVRTNYLTLKNTISLHFRIGDYSKLQLHYALLSDDYYVQAIETIFKATRKKDWNIIYFCEEKDNAAVRKRMYRIKANFPETSFHKASDELDDWEQLLLMSASNHNIIANSTFSWWAAYLNQTPDKIVVCPSAWFGAANFDKTTKDLLPPNWIKI